MDKPKSASPKDGSTLLQVGALPIRIEDGHARILLITSRGTRRWIIPKGWPMKGMRNWAAAAQEAKEEAGVIGKAHKKPIGSYLYFKRRDAHFDLCRVEVYLLEYQKTLEHFREKGQRSASWFSCEEAAKLVDEPGLGDLMRELEGLPFKKRKRRELVVKKSRAKA